MCYRQMEALVKLGTSSPAGEVCMSATKTTTKYTHTSLTESSILIFSYGLLEYEN